MYRSVDSSAIARLDISVQRQKYEKFVKQQKKCRKLFAAKQKIAMLK